VISGATHRLVQGYFTAAALGPQSLKGVAAPVPVYRILEVSAAQGRLDVAAATGLTPLVGRESEVALLLERWAQSTAGRGQVVLLRGEAGIGKSRLVEVLRERVIHEGATRIAFRCSPYHQNSVLYPMIDYLLAMRPRPVALTLTLALWAQLYPHLLNRGLGWYAGRESKADNTMLTMSRPRGGPCPIYQTMNHGPSRNLPTPSWVMLGGPNGWSRSPRCWPSVRGTRCQRHVGAGRC